MPDESAPDSIRRGDPRLVHICPRWPAPEGLTDKPVKRCTCGRLYRWHVVRSGTGPTSTARPIGSWLLIADQPGYRPPGDRLFDPTPPDGSDPEVVFIDGDAPDQTDPEE